MKSKVPQKQKLLKSSEASEDSLQNLVFSVIESNPVSLQVIDCHGNHLLENQAFRNLFGSSPNDDYNILNDSEYNRLQLTSEILKALRGRSIHLPNILYHPANVFEVTESPRIQFDLVLTPVKDATGDIEYILATHVNLPNFKIRETKQKEYQNHFRSQFDSIQEGLYQSDLHANFTAINRTGAEILGYDDPEELINGKIRTLDLFLDRGDRELMISFVREQGYVRNFVFHASKKDGTKIWIEATVNSRINKSGKIIGFEGIFRDITKRKNTERQIVDLKDFNESIVRNAPIGILTADLNGAITSANPALIQLLGSPGEEATKKLNLFTLPELRQAGFDKVFRKVLSDGEPIEFETEYTSHWGKMSYVWFRVVPRVDELGNITGLIAIIEDISQRKLAENQVIHKQRELERLLYTISHDLKTPLIAVNGFAKILGRDYASVLDDQGRNYLEFIQQGAQRMESLIKDLLEFSRLGEIKCEFRNENSIEIIMMAVREVQYLLDEKKIELIIQAKKFPQIQCDRQRIIQLIINLLTNAIKFTGDNSKPRIEIGYAELPEYHQFCVIDNGIGIEQKHQDKIFRIFQTVEQNPKYSQSTGVGLAIVKRISENHGGKAWVESEPGKGSAFYFSIRRKQSLTSE
ncbi:PAS domain-containing sensor histidine kinase [candidate division KSB1 bacterium]|nr:PAS domain-containing sensor histidine kinase [candidate division KSB1 bacterium]